MARRAKISSKLREKLLSQKSKMSSGTLIDNKKFTKGRFRILPAPADEVPGIEYVSIYCDSLEKDKKSTTSPSAYGLRCPVLDAQEQIRMTGDKEDKQFAWDFMNVTREYWMPVIDRAMEGDADKPNIRILRAKKRIYEQMIDYMVDEDDGEDITDVKTGRDVRIRRKGSGTDTEWTIKFLDPEVLSEDKAYAKAVLALNADFNVSGYFYSVDWDILEEIYKGLTGEDEIPEDYDDVKEQLKAGKSSDDDEQEDGEPENDDEQEDGEPENDDEPEEEGGEEDAAPEDADEPEEEGGEDDDEPEGEITVGMTVKFTNDDGEEVQGELTDTGEDADGDTFYEVNDGNDVWTVYEVEPVEEPEDDEEPDEVEPTVDKMKSAKKKKATAAKKKKTPNKPAAANKSKPKASSKIRANLNKNKKKAKAKA